MQNSYIPVGKKFEKSLLFYLHKEAGSMSF